MGYKRLSLIRASSGVNRQFTLAPAPLRAPTQAATSACNVAWSAMRRARHCRLNTLNSISAMFSQLPCLGV